MKYRYLLIVVFALCLNSYAASKSPFRQITPEQVQAAFNQPIKQHPRLFITNKQITEIKTKIESQQPLKTFYQAMLAKADGILQKPPVKRIKTGRRLLAVSRLCLDRVVHLSAAYRFTGKKTYLKRAEKEMLAAAAFSDWNPSHFLDVAEMTAALAIGYDWLYDGLAKESRQKIRLAILEKGLRPSLENNSWVNRLNNWNQVCNGGITLGALAIMEHQPRLAKKLVHRAVNGIQVVMKQYEPDGAYTEGPGYWAYGTTYNVVFLEALESVLGTDFNLSQAPGFTRTGSYQLHVTAPTGLYFNYPDSGLKAGFLPAVFWFAHKYDQPTLAWNQYQLWKDLSEQEPSKLVQGRFSPLALLWYSSRQAVPKQLSWMGRGSNPVAMFRNSWTDPQAAYLAIKGGSPGVNHGHMDVGSFVIDSQALRWASDLGAESYHKIESLGMDLWSRSQDAERWKIFRYNNFSHNTLVVNGRHQRVNGSAPIIRYSDKQPFPHVVFDMSDVYEGQLAQALRGAALLDNGQVIIQDQFSSAEKPATVRWAMVTTADIFIESSNTALLKQKAKAVRLTVLTDEDIKLRTYSTGPKADYDAPNPGTRLIGFELSLAPQQQARTIVIINPSSATAKLQIEPKSVLEWSNPR